MIESIIRFILDYNLPLTIVLLAIMGVLGVCRDFARWSRFEAPNPALTIEAQAYAARH